MMDALDQFRRPEYTGSNRCWPCTALNLVLVALAAVWLAVRRRRLVGLLVAAVGVAAVVLRGYVVPYTPTIAPQLVAASPLPDDLFKTEAAPAGERASLTAADLDGEAVFEGLLEAGAVEASGEMVLPAESVDATWREEMDRLATLSLEELAAVATRALPADEVAPYTDTDGEWLLVDGEELVARPVAVAELAAYRALDGVVEDTGLRLAGAGAFPMFLEQCPVCATDLTESSTVSCCGGHSQPRENPADVLLCPACDQRVYTFPAE